MRQPTVTLHHTSLDPIEVPESSARIHERSGWSREAPTDSQPDFDRMTVAELREYAAEHDIDLTGCNAKADVVEAVKKAPAPVADPPTTNPSEEP